MLIGYASSSSWQHQRRSPLLSVLGFVKCFFQRWLLQPALEKSSHHQRAAKTTAQSKLSLPVLRVKFSEQKTPPIWNYSRLRHHDRWVMVTYAIWTISTEYEVSTTVLPALLSLNKTDRRTDGWKYHFVIWSHMDDRRVMDCGRYMTGVCFFCRKFCWFYGRKRLR